MRKLDPKAAHLGQCEPVHDRAHGVFANAEVQIATAVFLGLEIPGSLKCKPRFGRGRQVGRTADQPGIMRCDGVEDLGR